MDLLMVWCDMGILLIQCGTYMSRVSWCVSVFLCGFHERNCFQWQLSKPQSYACIQFQRDAVTALNRTNQLKRENCERPLLMFLSVLMHKRTDCIRHVYKEMASVNHSQTVSTQTYGKIAPWECSNAGWMNLREEQHSLVVIYNLTPS